MSPQILISAGEVSGDIVGARLAYALRAHTPQVQLSGLGGPHMERAGVSLVTAATHLGTVGVSETLSSVPQGLRAFAATRRYVHAERPSAAVLIGNDLFNGVLGRWLRRRGIPTIALFPPQVWLWQPLVPLFAGSFDLVLAAFPEESSRYQRAGVRTEFVGHYLADELAPVQDEHRRLARERLALPPDGPLVGVLPGSRAHELERLLPVLGRTITALAAADPHVRIVLPVVAGHQARLEAWAATLPPGVVHQVHDSHDAMRASDVLVCCSGTATLEASLLGVPHVILYRMSTTTWLTAQTCIRLGLLPDDTVGLPNLLLGRGTVLELKQRHLTPERVVRWVRGMIEDDSARRQAHRRLAEVHALIRGPHSVERVAQLVLAEAAAS
jgi:lipid-A-disaccharide synthase